MVYKSRVPHGVITTVYHCHGEVAYGAHIMPETAYNDISASGQFANITATS
jgi:hypothetical protein